MVVQKNGYGGTTYIYDHIKYCIAYIFTTYALGGTTYANGGSPPISHKILHHSLHYTSEHYYPAKTRFMGIALV